MESMEDRKKRIFENVQKLRQARAEAEKRKAELRKQNPEKSQKKCCGR